MEQHNEIDVIKLNACKYNEIPSNTYLYNKQELDYYLWVYLKPDECANSYLYSVVEVSGSEDVCPPLLAFKRESECWIKVDTGYLNITPGLHTYKLSFVEKSSDALFSRYIAYIIQDDDPEKPYIYMHREEDKQ